MLINASDGRAGPRQLLPSPLDDGDPNVRPCRCPGTSWSSRRAGGISPAVESSKSVPMTRPSGGTGTKVPVPNVYLVDSVRNTHEWPISSWSPAAPRGRAPSLVAMDLAGPGYHINRSNLLVLESKADMQKCGQASPDDGDALALTLPKRGRHKECAYGFSVQWNQYTADPRTSGASYRAIESHRLKTAIGHVALSALGLTLTVFTL